MERYERFAALLILLEELDQHGSWCGETHLQKSAYLSQELLGVPLDFDFTLYKHGPYAFELTDELTAMRALMVLSLRVRPLHYGPTFITGETSVQVRKRWGHRVERFRHQFSWLARILGNSNVADLERLATAFFVTREQPGSSELERAKRLHDLKPHIPESDALMAVRKMDKMVCEAREQKMMLPVAESG